MPAELDDIKGFFEGDFNDQMFDAIIEPIKDALLSAFGSIQTWFEKNFNIIKNFIGDEVIGPLNDGVNYIKQLPDFIKSESNFVKDTLENKFVEVGNSIKEDIMTQVENARSDMENLGETVTGSFQEIATGLEGTFVDLGNTLYNGIDGIGNQLEETFVGVFDSMIDTFETIGDDLTNVFDTVFSAIIQIGLWLWECIQYIINCFTCVAYYAQKIFSSFCVIFYIFRLVMLIIWGFILAFLYMINKPDWAGSIMNGIYNANEFF